MKILSVFVLALSFAGVSHAADLKIGVVDMAQAFAEFHETKAAQAQLLENAQKAKEQMDERVNSLKKLAEELEKIRKEARDPVLSEQIRGKKAAEFESKAQEMRSLERDIQEFRQKREGQLQAEGMQQRKGLYEKIVKAVSDKSKADSYDLVFDKSGLGASGLPMLIHAKEGVAQDFTAEVIVELNKGAPAGGAAAPPAATPVAPAATPKKKK